MTAVVVVVAVFAYLGFLALALLWAAGCRQADRIERRWVAPRPERWESSTPITPEAVRRTFREES